MVTLNNRSEFQKPKESKGKFVSFSRENVNPPSVAPLYMNDKVNPTIMECTKDNKNGGRFQVCQFTDKHNQRIVVHKISFITNQASNPRTTAYPHPQGEMVMRTEFPKGNVECEFFGLIETGLTVNCKDIYENEAKKFGSFGSL